MGRPTLWTQHESTSRIVASPLATTQAASLIIGPIILFTMNPGTSFSQTTTCLPSSLQNATRRLDRLVAGPRSLDHLHERHHDWRVEEVHSDDVLRPARGRGDLRDRDAARVRGEERALRERVQTGEERLLQVQALGGRLYDEARNGRPRRARWSGLSPSRPPPPSCWL